MGPFLLRGRGAPLREPHRVRKPHDLLSHDTLVFGPFTRPLSGKILEGPQHTPPQSSFLGTVGLF